MRGGGQDDEEPVGPSDDVVSPSDGAVSPYLKGGKPKRRSVIPPSQESFVFPSGRVARPAEDYLVQDGPESDQEGDKDGEVGDPDGKGAEWLLGQAPAESGDGSDSWWGLPKWAPWVAMGAVLAGIVVAAWVGGFGSSPAPHGSGSPTASETPGIPGSFDDGIASDEYPEAADWRGEGYPEALTMEEWVWSRIGSGWAIVLFAGSSSTDGGTLPVPVVYLVSPEGVYFDLAELPSRVAQGATLVSWHEEERTARIVWDYGTRGGLLHLQTGEVEDTSFGLTAGRTREIQFLAADAADKEIWSAWGLDGLETRYYAWTPEASWEWILSDQDDLHVEWFVNPTSPDSTDIVLQIHSIADSLLASERSLTPGVPNFVVYSLDTGEDQWFLPAVPYSEPDCWFTGWIDSASVGYSCWDEASGVQTDFRVFVDGSGRVEEDDGSRLWYQDLLDQETVRHPTEPIELEVDVATAEVLGVRVLKGTEIVTVVDLDTHLGGSGRTLSTFDEVSPGVFRFVTTDGIVIGIDVELAVIGPTVLATTKSGVPLLGRSHVFYDEATPSGAGLDWGL